MIDHTFAICAYGKSPYLSACIESVLNQSGAQSEVYLASSTPSEWLDEVGRRYGVPVYINPGEGGIGPDWNFAYSKAQGRFVTITHQDDLYCGGYAQDAVSKLSSARNPLMYFCDYGEMRDETPVDSNLNLRVKRTLLVPLKLRPLADTAFAKRFALAFGNAICCPSVCFNREALPEPPFRTDMKNALDWDCWERLSRMDGSFCYSPRILMYHRIHEESATTENIMDNVRADEDVKMLERFWPKPVAAAINRLYAHSMDSNRV
ncbi:MAG: glycosyltransferase [Atopobiaceae bacterium]|nr:glycosyltransferase [Atopobiaceae bacterium]